MMMQHGGEILTVLKFVYQLLEKTQAKQPWREHSNQNCRVRARHKGSAAVPGDALLQ